MIALGFCGTFAAGKDLAVHLVEEKFKGKAFHVSTGDLVRDETAHRGLSLARENLQLVSNDMRFTRGLGILGRIAAEKISKQRGKQIALVSGIRNVGEVEELRKAFGNNFSLIAIDAPIKLRYERVKHRARAGEQVLSFAEFKASQEKELKGAAHSQNILAVMKMADFAIQNTGTKTELREKIEGILYAILKK